MRTILWLLLLTSLVAVVVEAQEKPDFSGSWVLQDPPQSSVDIPRVLTIRQPLRRTTARGEPMPPVFLDFTVEKHFESEVRTDTYHIGWRVARARSGFLEVAGRVVAAPCGGTATTSASKPKAIRRQTRANTPNTTRYGGSMSRVDCSSPLSIDGPTRNRRHAHLRTGGNKQPAVPPRTTRIVAWCHQMIIGSELCDFLQR